MWPATLRRLGNVTQFRPGDEVFGACISDPQASGAKVWVHRQGAFAEYVCAPESILVMKPDNVTFEQAASVPVAVAAGWDGEFVVLPKDRTPAHLPISGLNSVCQATSPLSTAR